VADVGESLAVVVEQLGHERASTYTSRIGLGDANDTRDVTRPEARTDACATGSRVGRRHVRVGAVVQVEESRLGTFEEDVGVGGKRVVQQRHGVGDVGDEACAEFIEPVDDFFDVEFLAAGIADQLVLRRSTFTHETLEALGVADIADADTHAAHLVGVGRADTAQRCAELVVAAHCFRNGVMALVPREDEVCPARDFQVCAGVATRFQHVDFFEECRQVDDDAVADHGSDVRVQDARRDELQGVLLTVDNDGVAGVVAALVTHDIGVLFGQQVDDLGFAFVAPLGSDYDGDWHDAPRPESSGRNGGWNVV